MQQARRTTLTPQSLLDAIPASAVVVDRNGRIQMTNRHWRQFCVDEGGRLASVSPPGDYLRVCDQETADGIRAVLDRRLDRFEVEYPCHGPDAERWFRMIVTPQEEAALVVHVNITGEYERVSRWLHTTVSPMIELDPRGSAVFVNQAWADLQRAPRAALLGSEWKPALAHDARRTLEDAVQATVADRLDRTVDIAVAVDQGPAAWIRFLVSAYCDEYQRLQRISLVGMDVTTARQLNEQLAASAERERIAVDIHDVVIQDLFAAGLLLAGVRAGHADPELLSEVTASLDRSIADLRALSTTLPSQRRQLTDLEAVLHRATLALGFEPETCVEVDLGDLSAEVAGALMPVLNEALSNVARHARATRVLVSLTQDSDDLLLTVRDDGIGMPPAPTRSSGTDNIARRAEHLGGTARWSAADGGGTVLEWRVPLRSGSPAQGRLSP